MVKHLYRGESDSVGFVKTYCGLDISLNQVNLINKNITCKNCLKVDSSQTNYWEKYYKKNRK